MYRNIISIFEPIDLKGLRKVSLAEGTDKKFWVPIKDVCEILNEISEDYYILEMNHERMFQYNTYYYDINDDFLYISNHNGILNKYKVRKRTCVETKTTFLEIKSKSKNGETIKKRISGSGDQDKLTNKEKRFLKQYFSFDPNALKQKSFNSFKRITLIDKSFKECCNIDFCFRFRSNCTIIERDNFAIIELKRDRNLISSKLYNCLSCRGNNSTDKNKYYLDRSFTEERRRIIFPNSTKRELNRIIQN